MHQAVEAGREGDEAWKAATAKGKEGARLQAGAEKAAAREGNQEARTAAQEEGQVV